MKNFELIEIYKTLDELSQANIKFPGAINFARKINIERIKPIITVLNEELDDLLRKYGTTEDNVHYTISEENRNNYIKERLEIENTEASVNLQKFDFNLLNSIDIEPKIFDVLYKMSTYEEE